MKSNKQRLLATSLLSLCCFSIWLNVATAQAQDRPLKTTKEVSHGYPDVRERPVSFTVTRAGIVLVPISGGLYVADFDGWLIRPSEQPIQSAASTNKYLFMLRDLEKEVQLVKRSPPFASSQETVLAKLSAGSYRLSPAGDNSVWVWGRQTDGRWLIAHYADLVHTIYDSKLPVSAIGSASSEAIATAIGRVVTLLRRGERPVALFESTSLIRGLAVGPDGSLYIANDAGVSLVKNDSQRLLTRSYNGDLQIHSSSLYVLDDARSRIVQLDIR